MVFSYPSIQSIGLYQLLSEYCAPKQHDTVNRFKVVENFPKHESWKVSGPVTMFVSKHPAGFFYMELLSSGSQYTLIGWVEVTEKDEVSKVTAGDSNLTVEELLDMCKCILESINT
jgi:hypothetical protein